MPKVKISEYSATANSNTDVASINIDEGCAPSGINNAIRAVMGHLKDFQQGTYGDPFNGPVNGTLGATTASTANVTTLTTSSTVTHNGGTANGVAYLNGSKVLTTGSALTFSGSALAVTGSISSTGGFTSNTTITAQLDGSDSAGAGPGWNLFNTAFSRGWRTQLSASNNKVDYYFNGSAYVQMTTLNTNGALALSGASTSANGVGITFPATQSASSDANTLDDYEEGTWTPNIAGITVVGTFSSSGIYTKVGRMITVVANFQGTTSVAVAAGAGFSTNLPFPCGNYGIDMPGTFFKFGQAGGEVIAAQNDTRFYTGAAITATTNFQISVTYFTA